MSYLDLGVGEVVIFLHGFNSSKESFMRLINGLSKDVRVLAMDLAGFGKTSPLKKPYDVLDYANFVIQFMDNLKIEKAVIIGHSMGGRIAIKLASLYRERVKKLVLIASAGLKPRRKLAYIFKKIKYKMAKRRLDKKTLEEKFFSSDYNSLKNDIYKESFKKIVNENLLRGLKDIECETLIINGEKDRDIPVYMGKKLNRNIKNSGLIIIEGAGHFCFIDNYILVNSVLREFILNSTKRRFL